MEWYFNKHDPRANLRVRKIGHQTSAKFPRVQFYINKIVQGQYPANLSHCIFAQIEVMIIYPRRKHCSQHWYWKINVVAVLWLSIKSFVFYQTYRDDQTKGIRIK